MRLTMKEWEPKRSGGNRLLYSLTDEEFEKRTGLKAVYRDDKAEKIKDFYTNHDISSKRFQELLDSGWLLYTQIDGEGRALWYEFGNRWVNRTGVYAVIKLVCKPCKTGLGNGGCKKCNVYKDWVLVEMI